MRLSEILQKNPFPRSIEQRILYHGTNNTFEKFKREAHGIYVTPSRSWAEDHYGNHILAIYANITKMKHIPINSKEADYFYEVDYDNVSHILADLSQQGYNAAMFGGESESMVLFNDIDIINVATSQLM